MLGISCFSPAHQAGLRSCGYSHPDKVRNRQSTTIGKSRRHFSVRAVPSAAPPIPKEVSGALVYPGAHPIKGICHFLGGAFACAAPQVVYPLIIENIVSAGYTVIVTPFAITFKHKECAHRLHGEFWTSLDELRSSSLAYSVPNDVPVHGVGHSLGALMHLLIGSLDEERCVDSNVLIAVNNKEIKDAVPVPGLFESLKTALTALDSLPFGSVWDPLLVLKDITSLVVESGDNKSIKELIKPTIVPSFDQIESVLGELKDGVEDFIPTPSESRNIVRDSYHVPSTLLVRFSNDTIDETPEITGCIKTGKSVFVSNLGFDGDHLTPVGGSLDWLGIEYLSSATSNLTKADAQAKDRFFKGIIGWMDSFIGEEVDNMPSI